MAFLGILMHLFKNIYYQYVWNAVLDVCAKSVPVWFKSGKMRGLLRGENDLDMSFLRFYIFSVLRKLRRTWEWPRGGRSIQVRQLVLHLYYRLLAHKFSDGSSLRPFQGKDVSCFIPSFIHSRYKVVSQTVCYSVTFSVHE